MLAGFSPEFTCGTRAWSEDGLTQMEIFLHRDTHIPLGSVGTFVIPPSSCSLKPSPLISHALQRRRTLLAHRYHHAICFRFVPRALPLCKMSREREKCNYLVMAVLTQGRAMLTSHSLSVLLTNCPWGCSCPIPVGESPRAAPPPSLFTPHKFFSGLFLLKKIFAALQKRH